MPALDRVPAELDLTGTIVVLAHPRTGSSLLMQTLHLLGASVIGEYARPELPPETNPRGFFENRELLVHGLKASALARDPALLRGRAVKIALTHLTARRADDEWCRLFQPGVLTLLPLRSPTESLRSLDVFLRTPDDRRARSSQLLRSIRENLADWGRLASIVTTPGFTGSPPACLDYRIALNAPADYVDQVAAAARLPAAPAQRAAAVANIDRQLYRFQATRAEAEKWDTRVELLERIHEILRGTSPAKWTEVRARLPAWTLAPAAAVPARHD